MTMKRSVYLELAGSGLRMPIGTDLLLHEQADPEAVMHDGARLGEVVVAAARRYGTPLAMPLMDLRIEKAALLRAMNVADAEIDGWHFSKTPADDVFERIERDVSFTRHARPLANLRAIERVARERDLIPVGMAIGPFSLMTKLLADPITPVYLAGTGLSAEDDEEVRCVERVLELATRVVLKSIDAQLDAGAAAICICEPAANTVYLSPNQLQAGSDIFERYVMAFNRRVKAKLDGCGADLIFHDCGELLDDMVAHFVTLDPAMLSLGSSRVLWDDARLVPSTTVLYGNLPSKRFYDDALVSRDDVTRMSAQLIERMQDIDHPFILGSECDVLSVQGCHDTIKGKVTAMLHAPTCSHAHAGGRHG
jgi:uroporphyrinogen-III decarboxylase